MPDIRVKICHSSHASCWITFISPILSHNVLFKMSCNPPFRALPKDSLSRPVRLLHPSSQTFGRWDVRRGLSVGWGVESQFVLAASPLRFFSFRPCSLCSFHDPVFTYLCWGATLRERSPRARVAWEALVCQNLFRVPPRKTIQRARNIVC